MDKYTQRDLITALAWIVSVLIVTVGFCFMVSNIDHAKIERTRLNVTEGVK